MSRFRLLPTPEQQAALLKHCRDARYVWNLAVEQQQHWQPGRTAPGYVEQAAQLLFGIHAIVHAHARGFARTKDHTPCIEVQQLARG